MLTDAEIHAAIEKRLTRIEAAKRAYVIGATDLDDFLEHVEMLFRTGTADEPADTDGR